MISKNSMSPKMAVFVLFLFVGIDIVASTGQIGEFLTNLQTSFIYEPLSDEMSGAPCVLKDPSEYAGYRPATFRTSDGMKGWSLQLPEGFPLATPAYDDGILFVGGGFGSYSFYAVNAENGRIKWAVNTGDDGPTAAVVKNGIVVFNTESCVIYALKARDGQDVWHRWLGDPLMSQPAISGRKVFMAYPGANGHVLACFDLFTGVNYWNKSIVSDIISAPVVCDSEIYLSTFDGMVYCYKTKDGEELWRENYNASSAPWIYGDKIYTSMRQDEEILDKTGTSFIQRFEGLGYFERGSGRQINETPINYMTADYLNADRTSASGQQQADLDAQVGFSSTPSTAQLGLAEENVGVFSVSGAWSYQGSRPLIYDSDLFSAQGDVVTRNDPESGEMIWQYEYQDTLECGRALTPPAIVNDKIFVGSSTGEILCLDAGNGNLLWSYNCGEPIVFQPSVMDGKIFWGTTLGKIFCLETGDEDNTGWAMWGGNSEHNGWVE
ncbi:PQQ-binding-like beta-propeller repeat protein [candidate division WOR-3 bacterium]|nr:PQQ-binding-like beta-propeller repeat protein [candidate division WOR-3 bacterium]